MEYNPYKKKYTSSSKLQRDARRYKERVSATQTIADGFENVYYCEGEFILPSNFQEIDIETLLLRVCLNAMMKSAMTHSKVMSKAIFEF